MAGIQRFFSSPAVIGAMLVAIFAQMVSLLYFQVINNDRQEAAINANSIAISEIGNRITNVESKQNENLRIFNDYIKRLDAFETGGMRGLSRIDEQHRHIMDMLDKLYNKRSR